VTIGNGAVVAGGAIVTRDVAPYMIVAGIHAKPLRRRFSESIAARMEELAWWDWPHERLHASLKDFQTLPAEAFLEKYS
jgi:tetrahydrodipicolinate N-succinyltransferase